MILLTSVFLEIFTAQIISIYNYFSGLSSELEKSEGFVFFLNVSSNNQRITTHSPRDQPQLMPSQATLPNLALKSDLWPLPWATPFYSLSITVKPSTELGLKSDFSPFPLSLSLSCLYCHLIHSPQLLSLPRKVSKLQGTLHTIWQSIFLMQIWAS